VTTDEKKVKVDVFFVDYGHSEYYYGDAGYLSCDAFRPMPVFLRRLPFQAIECSLLDIEWVEDFWTDDVCDIFCDLYLGKNFQAQVC